MKVQEFEVKSLTFGGYFLLIVTDPKKYFSVADAMKSEKLMKNHESVQR